MTPLKAFISYVKNDGLALTSHFLVRVYMPQGLLVNNILVNHLDKIMMFCESTNLPGINYATTPVRTFGEVEERPYERIYDPVALSFYVDTKLTVKKLFDNWVSIIQENTSRIFQFSSVYTSNIDIIVYDRGDNKTYMVRLHEAFPKTVDSIALSYDQSSPMRVRVVFAYKYYTINTLSSTGIPSEFNGILNAPIGLPYFDSLLDFQSTLNNLQDKIGSIESAGNIIGRAIGL